MTDPLLSPPPQPTALLHHALPAGPHYDWLIARPGQERLWTARVNEPSSRWATLGRFDLQELPPHRRSYLTYEGPISGDRGRVSRVDEGQVVIRAWDADAATLEITMRHFLGTLRLLRVAPEQWIAQTLV